LKQIYVDGMLVDKDNGDVIAGKKKEKIIIKLLNSLDMENTLT
jgi:hypothetical protein